MEGEIQFGKLLCNREIICEHLKKAWADHISFSHQQRRACRVRSKRKFGVVWRACSMKRVKGGLVLSGSTREERLETDSKFLDEQWRVCNRRMDLKQRGVKGDPGTFIYYICQMDNGRPTLNVWKHVDLFFC